MKKGWMRIMSVLASILFLLFLLALLISLVGTSYDAYSRENEALNTAKRTGMSEYDLNYVTDRLTTYLRDGGHLNMAVHIDGELREVFNEKEKIHMEDVRALFVMLRTAMFIAGIAFVLLAACVLLLGKRRGLRTLTRCLFWSTIGLIVCILLVALWALADFTGFWSFFHTVFFTNDLWLLNPNTDILIQIMPQSFFQSLITKIMTYYGLCIAVLLGCTGTWTLYWRKKRLRGEHIGV
ncbi:MAG: TIGR01906 family membrane protein [Christensenellales bacterium]